MITTHTIVRGDIVVGDSEPPLPFKFGNITNFLDHKCGPDHPCALLEAFDLTYLDQYGVILCRICRGGSFIYISGWVSHLSSGNHPFTCAGKKEVALNYMRDHLMLRMPRLSAITSLPKSLHTPIEMEGMRRKRTGSLLRCYPCSMCAAVIHAKRFETRGADTEDFFNHMRDNHPKTSSALQPVGTWYQKIWIVRGSKATPYRHSFQLPPDWVPPVDPEYPPAPRFGSSVLQSAPINATWMAETGMSDYVLSLGKFDFKSVKSLAALPSTQLVSAAKGKHKWEYIESGLLAAHRCLSVYLKGANDFIYAQHSSVRTDISKRSGGLHFQSSLSE